MSQNLFKTLHAIQLISVETRELFIRLNGPIDGELTTFYSNDVKFNSAHTEFDKDGKIIHVGLRLSLGMEKEKPLPISMRIEILGTFNINIDEFPEDQINSWADKNAPFILYPFIREHGFALTTRCGLPPIVLPLLQVPTLTKESNE